MMVIDVVINVFVKQVNVDVLVVQYDNNMIDIMILIFVFEYAVYLQQFGKMLDMTEYHDHQTGGENGDDYPVFVVVAILHILEVNLLILFLLLI
jgi:hypothetical protein